MVCLGLEPGAAGWKAQTNPLSYGGTPICTFVYLFTINCNEKTKKLKDCGNGPLFKKHPTN